MTTKIYISQIETSLASIGQSIVVGSNGFEFTNLVGYTGSQGPVGAPTTSQLLTGNGSNTEFTLLGTVLSTKNIFVAVNGLIQIHQGSVGFQGPDGNIGPTGYQGSIGDVGFRGSAGAPGGSTGYTGSASTVPGYTGSQGAVGAPTLSQLLAGNGCWETIILKVSDVSPHWADEIVQARTFVP